jgi:glycosyltransferase involved in cell wall biosynthesis
MQPSQRSTLLPDRILLFIPAYNCEKQIARVLEKLTPEVLAHIDTVIVVNNRSTDSTEDVATGMVKDIKGVKAMVLRNRANYGLGGSHKVAFQYALDNNFSHVIVFHGDDQGDIRDLLPYLDQGLHNRHDCLLGARFHKNSNLVGYSTVRKLGNIAYNSFFSILLRKVILDLGSGLNIYEVSMLRDKFYSKFPDDLTFNYCMVMAASYYSHNIYFFPITWREEDQVSNVRIFSQAVNVLRMLLSFTLRRRRFITSELRARAIENYDADVAATNGAD